MWRKVLSIPEKKPKKSLSSMATPAKKAKTDPTPTDQRPCPYGSRCYRKNPKHFEEYSHPDADSTDTTTSTSTDHAFFDSAGLPPCKYGAKCYRKNLLHFAEFSHPTQGPTTDPSFPADDSEGDTEVYDSDDEDDKKKKDQKDVLNRGMSLVKSFSQMTEAERKELIQKAFEAKQKLQEELAATKKEVEEKERELKRLQDEVNTGMLLLDGEKEALEGSETVYFPLFPERSYKEGSAAQIHFRLAESQFYRLLSGEGHSAFRVTKVEYVVTPHLVKRFREAREDLKNVRGEDMSYPVLGFHGTDVTNISLICQNGFKVPGQAGFHHKTDTGYYGAGVYFSEYPSYSMSYISGSTKLLLSQVLPGKVFHCTKLIHGAKLKPNHDSHMSPCKKELIIFNSHHILPCYVVHYTQCSTQFQYQKIRARKKGGPHAPKMTSGSTSVKYKKALGIPATSIFKGTTFKIIGKNFCQPAASLGNLITKHQGKKVLSDNFDIMIASNDVDVNTAHGSAATTALNSDRPVVTEEYLYECIIQKKQLDPDYFLHSIHG